MQAKGKINDISVEQSEIFVQCYDFNPALLFQQHRKVLDKGKPDDIMPAIKGTKVREVEGTSILILFVLH